MNKDEQLAFAKKEILDRINSWEDLYEFLAEIMKIVAEEITPPAVLNALYTMYAFICAMRELPEEGDIKKLVERMIHIIVYESKEKLGTEITIMSPEELGQIYRAVAERAAMLERAAAVVSEKPKVLH